MTTKTDITLPALPMAAFPGVAVRGHGGVPRYLFTGDQMQTYARAAVEADRQGRMPSDDDIYELAKDSAYDYEESIGETLRFTFRGLDLKNFVGAMLSRYGSSQPALEHAARELMDTEIAELACTGSDAPAEHALGQLKDALVSHSAASAEPVAEYTSEMGEAAQTYLDGFRQAHALPAEFLWADLWKVMLAAAPTQSVVNQQLTTEPTAQNRETALTQAARDVLAERQRQISTEGWTPEHDDEHADGEIARAAAAYALASIGWSATAASIWPWDLGWLKSPENERRNLEKAGALVLAEVERLDRATARAEKEADHG